MAGFKRMMSYLGLVDDDEYDDYDPYEDQPAARPSRPSAMATAHAEPEPASAGLRPMQYANATGDQPSGVTVQPQRSSVVRPIIPVQSSKPHTVTPKSFQDAQEIADRLKAGVPVIVNLQAADRDLMRRIIDFSSGLTYGIGGEMERTADRVYLLTPTARS
ncbi:MAG TPA: cell division protein SepF [Acidimicrobiales bacterium]|nr:cell division protein SepF [Acidimicrobiales bacterium]